MWDHETETLWQQGTFQGLVGALAGTRLEVIPSTIVPWEEFLQSYPQGKVLSEESYPTYDNQGLSDYNSYDLYASSGKPFSYFEGIDSRLPPLERVIGLPAAGKGIAYPFSQLGKVPVVHTSLGNRDIVILYENPIRSSPDDLNTTPGSSVGTAGVYVSEVDGKRLTFVPLDGGRFKDLETESIWSIFGRAIEGELKGKGLSPVFHIRSFWFYWVTTHPDTELWVP